MIRQFLMKWKLKLYPPLLGEIYYGDPFDFILGNLVEHCLHGTKTAYGTPAWEPIISDGCYRLTIESDAMPYYRCTAEVLCVSADGDTKAWKKRSQPRRIAKERFHDMIMDGRLKKYE
jgi:hypothetical protein